MRKLFTGAWPSG